MVLPTGTGKTYVSAVDASLNGKKVLYLAHQEQILRQARRSFDKLTSFKTSLYIGDEKQISDATFSTVQTMTKNCLAFPKNLFDYIIIDECHHAQTKSYIKILKHFKPKFLLGLTATPYRNDNLDIFKLCGEPYFMMKIREAIEKNLLAKINYYYVDNDINFSEIAMKYGKYDDADLNKKLLIPKYDEAILKEYKKSAMGKRTIVFCATIEHAERLKKLFESNGFPSAIAHSKMNVEDVRINIGKFFTGRWPTIFVRDLFNEGIDVPACDCIMLLRPTESKIIFEQQLGRGLRLTRRKKNVLVLDFTANSFNNKLNLEFLNSFSGGKLLNKIYHSVNESYEREEKETIVYDEMVNVRLNKKKIDILYHYADNIETRKKRLIENYLMLKKQLGKIPSAEDINRAHFGNKYGIESYRIVFGSWLGFKKMLNDNNKLEKEDIIRQIKDFYTKNGHYPTIKEAHKSHISVKAIVRLYKNYEKALIEAGGKPNKFNFLTKKQLVSDVLRVKKELGRTPFQFELDKKISYPSRYHILKLFKTKNYNVFLKKIGLKIPKKKKWQYYPIKKRKKLGARVVDNS